MIKVLKDFYQIQDAQGNAVYGHIHKKQDVDEWLYHSPSNLRDYRLKNNHSLNLHKERGAIVDYVLPADATIDWDNLMLTTIYAEEFKLVYVEPLSFLSDPQN